MNIINNNIPFFDYVVSEENFNSVKSFKNFNYVVEKHDDHFIIYFINNLPANMYYYKLNGKYAYCIDEEKLASYLENMNISLTINNNWNEFISQIKKKDSTIKHNKYNEIKCISLYDKLTLYVDHFDIIKINNLFSIDIYKAEYIIKKWIAKYKKLINDNKTHICAHLSSGLDTRSLTYFWKDLDIHGIYTKNDKDELPIVEDLHNKYFSHIPLFIGHLPNDNNLKNIITLSGKGMDVFTIKNRYCNQNFYKNNICKFNARQLINSICPYLDRDFCKIKPSFPHQLKITMQYLLAKDFMGIEYKSFKREKYEFNEETKKIANKVIKKWNIKL